MERSWLSTALAIDVRFDTPASQSRTSSGIPGCSTAILLQIASAFRREPATSQAPARRRLSVWPRRARDRSDFCTSWLTREIAFEDMHISCHSCAANHSLTTDIASYVLSLSACEKSTRTIACVSSGHLFYDCRPHRYRFRPPDDSESPIQELAQLASSVLTHGLFNA